MVARLHDTEIEDRGDDAARAFAATLHRNLRFVRDDEKPELVQALRERGWSYRRIAETLRVPYNIVSRWLSQPETTFELRPALPRAAPVTGTADAAAIQALVARAGDLERRLAELDRRLTEERRAAKGREERLLTTIDELKAEIAAAKRGA
jgi:predicted transcriptional regulator